MIRYLTDYVPKVLVACEQSQVVCKAFRENGLNAYSNDLNPCYGGCPEWHIIGDAREVVKGNTRGYYTEHRQWIKHCAHNSRLRAKTFEGIAEAMAIQWGALLKSVPG